MMGQTQTSFDLSQKWSIAEGKAVGVPLETKPIIIFRLCDQRINEINKRKINYLVVNVGLLGCNVCALVGSYQRFGGTYCLNIQG
jgi:hypothetical protein